MLPILSLIALSFAVRFLCLLAAISYIKAEEDYTPGLPRTESLRQEHGFLKFHSFGAHNRAP